MPTDWYHEHKFHLFDMLLTYLNEPDHKKGKHIAKRT